MSGNSGRLSTSEPALGQHSRRPRKVRMILLMFALSYVLAEAGLTAYERLNGELLPFLLIERTETEPVRFDPISGYRFGVGPHRVTSVWYGTTEFSHPLIANRQGFLDSSDFIPKRPDQRTKRIVVLGDSFTSAMHLETNWPNRAEALCRERGQPVEFLNFALDGVGLANWWSIVHNLLEPEGYEIDGMIFASYIDNLERKFLCWDSAGFKRLGWGRSRSWDPATFPQSLEQAQSQFYHAPMWIVGSSQFDDLTERTKSPFHLSFVGHARSVFWAYHGLTREGDTAMDDPHRLALIRYLGEYIRRRNLKAFVLQIPHRPQDVDRSQVDELIGWRGYMRTETARDYERFCELTGSAQWDMTDLYRGLTMSQVNALWNPNDPHTSQLGSDRIAEFIVERLSAELPLESK